MKKVFISNIYLYIHFRTFWKKAKASHLISPSVRKYRFMKAEQGSLYDSVVSLTKLTLVRFVKSPGLADRNLSLKCLSKWYVFKSSQFFQTYTHSAKGVRDVLFTLHCTAINVGCGGFIIWKKKKINSIFQLSSCLECSTVGIFFVRNFQPGLKLPFSCTSNPTAAEAGHRVLLRDHKAHTSAGPPTQSAPNTLTPAWLHQADRDKKNLSR